MTRMYRAYAMGAPAILLALAMCACQRSEPPAPVATAASPASSSQKPAAVASAASAASEKPSDKSHPTLKVTTFDGQPFDLSAQRGHWVVVNFWATWCGPCLQEIPDLSAFIKSRKDVAVIGLDYEEIEKPELASFLKQHTPGYPIAVIDTYHPPADFDTPRALPTSYLIGPDGSLVYKFLGPITIKDLQQKIDKAQGHVAG
jgi:thiol-disulfide isomerase/thioredoxin